MTRRIELYNKKANQLLLSFKLPYNILMIKNIKHIVAVASGKGGVGKSTVAVSLALALAKNYRVGILDADIYGPSIPTMFGIVNQKPEIVEQKYFKPIAVANIQLLSIGLVAGENTAMIWRGPMASSAVSQMLTKTVWGELDYLIIDFPPGTGDIQLTLSKAAKIQGAIIVTTPQHLAFQDVKKGIAMFKKVGIPTLGIVENMTGFSCPHCKKHAKIFSANREQRASDTILAELPIDLILNQLLDKGQATEILRQCSTAPLIEQLADRVVQDINRDNITFKEML